MVEAAGPHFWQGSCLLIPHRTSWHSQPRAVQCRLPQSFLRGARAQGLRNLTNTLCSLQLRAHVLTKHQGQAWCPIFLQPVVASGSSGVRSHCGTPHCLSAVLTKQLERALGFLLMSRRKERKTKMFSLENSGMISKPGNAGSGERVGVAAIGV